MNYFLFALLVLFGWNVATSDRCSDVWGSGCENNGTCTDDPRLMVRCICVKGFYGIRCQLSSVIRLQKVDPSPGCVPKCVHGVCEKNSGTCTCNAEFVGSRCDQKLIRVPSMSPGSSPGSSPSPSPVDSPCNFNNGGCSQTCNYQPKPHGHGSVICSSPLLGGVFCPHDLTLFGNSTFIGNSKDCIHSEISLRHSQNFTQSSGDFALKGGEIKRRAPCSSFDRVGPKLVFDGAGERSLESPALRVGASTPGTRDVVIFFLSLNYNLYWGKNCDKLEKDDVIQMEFTFDNLWIPFWKLNLQGAPDPHQRSSRGTNGINTKAWPRLEITQRMKNIMSQTGRKLRIRLRQKDHDGANTDVWTLETIFIGQSAETSRQVTFFEKEMQKKQKPMIPPQWIGVFVFLGLCFLGCIVFGIKASYC